MIGYYKGKTFCDLQCFNCDGWAYTNCLMAPNTRMESLYYSCLGYGQLLIKYLPQGLWAKHIILFPEHYGVSTKFPVYKGEPVN